MCRQAKKAAGPPPEPPRSKWRREHRAFQEVIRAARMSGRGRGGVGGGGGGRGRGGGGSGGGGGCNDDDDNDDGRVPCPHCGRSFAPDTAARHIPKCADTIHRPAPPPGMRGGLRPKDRSGAVAVREGAAVPVSASGGRSCGGGGGGGSSSGGRRGRRGGGGGYFGGCGDLSDGRAGDGGRRLGDGVGLQGKPASAGFGRMKEGFGYNALGQVAAGNGTLSGGGGGVGADRGGGGSRGGGRGRKGCGDGPGGARGSVSVSKSAGSSNGGGGGIGSLVGCAVVVVGTGRPDVNGLRGFAQSFDPLLGQSDGGSGGVILAPSGAASGKRGERRK